MPLRLTAFTVVPLVAILLVGGVLALSTLEYAFERRLQREVEMVARALRLPVSDALHDGRFGRLQRSLESAHNIGRVYGVTVYDSGGDVVAALGGGSDTGDREVSHLIEEGERTGEYASVAGREVYSYFVPLSGPGERINGLLEVTRRKRDIREFMEVLRLRGAQLLAVGVLLMGLIVIVGHYAAVGRSLRTLQRSIHRVESGDRQHRAPTRGLREVAAVSGSLNSMLDSIDEAERKVARERSSRELLEDELRRSEKLASIGRLAGGLAHELGGPLSLIDGHAQRALRDPDLSRTARQEIEVARREVVRVSQIVTKLLDYGRGGRRSPAPIEASRLVKIAVNAAAHEADSRGVTVDAEGAQAGVRIVGDDTRLEQALLNVVRNAIQAARSRVDIRWSAAQSAVTFTIDDDGPGIDPEIRDCLFEPFVTTRGGAGGTGLGLAIAHAAAAEHGGTLHFEASPLGGARFTLSLPLARRGRW